ncbi:hypothetical protein GWK16_09055 [Roseomonas sp. JC162]|uniref:Uncharacterized protein n=1 Tax=Neoroseomonas marina TaxID=1232220 RepID=A0A848EBI1_9PROT|nr:hypothetical protein [Neoroseomonas marina]NMJ41386.1 hypothetical protein [Neoroseomonas marina]
MPMHSEVAFALSSDGLFAALELSSGPVPSVLHLDALELEDLILQLARVREMMCDAVPGQLEPVFRASRVRSAQWVSSRTPLGAALSLRDPGLGWLHFLMSPEQCRDLADALNDLGRPAPDGRA